jgi:signal transduction histidine kinase
MIIIGADYHPGFQQMASVDTDTGEFQEKRLAHREDAEKFYRALAGQKVRVGMEASGHGRWFERLLSELHFELWIAVRDAGRGISEEILEHFRETGTAGIGLAGMRERVVDLGG